MPLSRREFLALVAAASTTVAGGARLVRAATARAAADPTLAALRTLVTERALGSDDPWVLMHVVLALGPDVKAQGNSILDGVSQRHATKIERGGKSYVGFPINVEAHPNHFLEIMEAVALSPTRKLPSPAGPITTADLLSGAEALFSPAITGAELSWTLSVFTAHRPPSADRFTNADGQTFTVSALVETAAQAAEVGYADTVAAQQGKKPYGRSTLQTYACNGTHVLYGLYDALRHGYEGKGLRERVRTLTKASYFRLTAEVALIDQVLSAPVQQLNADAAKLQFLGHSIENLRYAERHEIYVPDAGERERRANAERQLAEVVQRIATVHNLDELASSVPRAYRIILGDACHALHGLTSEA